MRDIGLPIILASFWKETWYHRERKRENARKQEKIYKRGKVDGECSVPKIPPGDIR